MVEFFINRPIFATVCALLIILAGAISIPTLPVAQYPTLAPPTITVTSAYNGANAEEVETAVTVPLERAINGVEGLKYLSSSSTNNGLSTITVTFDVTRDIDLAQVDVQNRINSVLGTLPQQVVQTGVTVAKAFGGGFVFVAGFYADHNQYDNLFISNYLDLYVTDAIKRVPGVSDVLIFGARTYAMRLWLDPAKMAARGLTATDVLQALRDQNVQIAAGSIGQPPAPNGQQYQYSVRTTGLLSTAAEFASIVLKTEANGTLVRVSDVGRAELGAQDYGSSIEYNGVQAMGIAVSQLPSANALDVDKAAQAELEVLAKQFPPGLHYAIAFDTTTVVSEGIRDVLVTLAEAIGLVILVMFLFLQDWRTTVIPAVTIPVSLIGAFAFVHLLGFSINMLTLFGITLATGLVVDDAIVVIENVERHLSEGITEPHRATAVAMTEVTSAIVATSLVLIAVFVPVSLFPGTTGIMFRQFGLTIAFSVAISAFNSLTLSPALSALLLGKAHPGKRGLWRLINNGITSFTNGYRHTLGGLIRWRWAVLLAFIAALGLTYWVYLRVPSSFLPEEDQGYFFVLVQAPPGASLGYTESMSRQAEMVLSKVPEVGGMFAVNGFSLAGSAPNQGMLFVRLKPFDERVGDAHTTLSVINRIRGQLFMIGGALVLPFDPPPIQGISQFGGFQFEVLDEGNNTPLQLYAATQKLIAAGNARPELTGLFSSFTASDPQLVVSVDRNKALSLGIPLSQVTDALQVFLGSVYVNNFVYNNRIYRVYVQGDEAFRNNPKDIGQYYVRSSPSSPTQPGAMVPLSNLVTTSIATTPQVIPHYNVFRSAEIDGSAKPGYSTGQAIAAMEDVAAKTLPRGMTYEWTGISLEEIQSAGKAAIFFGLGLLVVYLTLSALYESWVLPFIVMLGVPVAVLGGLGAQWIRGLQNDVYCQIGLVMLIGLASKNAILIVEFAEQLRRKGMGLIEAAIEAARIRLRPILMTSFAFILGVVPLVIATGAGSGGRHSVGTTVFGGMLLSTFLNLVFIPVLYVIVERMREHA
ncbi:MAG TPA: multidrug efflux RND transporter permease subunit [Terriglobales bacterium]|nr:multidrug efflux RND transporter permease subunit [Terriglobales bacterium]